MSNLITEDPVFIELEFNQKWIEIGILNFDNFSVIKKEYLKGEDVRSEHYRWGAFKDFFKKSSSIKQSLFYILYDIGKNDPDYAMGRAIIFDIIQHIDCPLELIKLATNDSDFTLAKHALKYQAIRER